VFEALWKSYPRKVGKPAARRAFKAKYNAHLLPRMRYGFMAWARYWHDARTEEQFIPHPATWLNQERYMDDPSALPAPKTNLSAAEQAIQRIRDRDSA